jgi:hypothetical protein
MLGGDLNSESGAGSAGREGLVGMVEDGVVADAEDLAGVGAVVDAELEVILSGVEAVVDAEAEAVVEVGDEIDALENRDEIEPVVGDFGIRASAVCTFLMGEREGLEPDMIVSGQGV